MSQFTSPPPASSPAAAASRPTLLRALGPGMALAMALGNFSRQILAETDDALGIWRERFRSALGPNGRLITDLVPEMEHVLGPQPPVPELPVVESQHRFNGVFCRFMEVACSGKGPLVIFLDDMQWADAASLSMLELVLASPGTQRLLFVAAFRDNEVTDQDPLMQTMRRLESGGLRVELAITVCPLFFYLADDVSAFDEDYDFCITNIRCIRLLPQQDARP